MSNKRNQRRGAAVFLEVLRSEGARYVFGNPGTTELPLIDALIDAPDIRYILALQEASAVAMADGYAQAASRPGVLNLHTAGGLGHGLGNLLNAHVSGTPLVVTAGQQDSRHTLTDDAIFALGGKSLITILYTEGSAVPPGMQIFQLSADARDLGRTYSTKLALVGDIRASLRALFPLLTLKLADRKEIYAGLRKAAEPEQEARRGQLKAAADAELDKPVTTPLVAGREMARAIGPEVAIVDEAPATLGALRAFLSTESTRQYSFARGGALGWGMPAAVGFSLGIDRSPVVSIVGDGAALYSPQALWTAAHERLPVTFVVINNREYNILKKFMRSQPHYASARANRFIAMDIIDPVVDFMALAASMGVPAQSIGRATDIAPALEAAIASGAPNLIEIPVSPA
jgi:benzoylformate decarboxylase